MKRYLLVLFFSVSTLLSWGQLLPYGLRLEKVQTELKEVTAGYDSLIFIDYASFWADDIKMFGFAYSQSKVFQITVEFEEDTTHFYDIKVKKLKSRTIRNKQRLSQLEEINYSTLKLINSDSLNIKSRNGEPYISVSDGSEWTILLIYQKPSELILLQSYLPETYQKSVPTKDRRLFIKTSRKLNLILRK